MFTGIKGMSTAELAEALAREIRKSDATVGVKVEDSHIHVKFDGIKYRIDVREVKKSAV